eukprot:ANDGO_03686.mRNA.1 hypothetical protein
MARSAATTTVTSPAMDAGFKLMFTSEIGMGSTVLYPSHCGRFVAFTADDGLTGFHRLRVYDVLKECVVHECDPTDAEPFYLHWSPDSTFLVGLTPDSEVTVRAHVFDIYHGKVFPFLGGSPIFFSFSPSNLNVVWEMSLSAYRILAPLSQPLQTSTAESSNGCDWHRGQEIADVRPENKGMPVPFWVEPRIVIFGVQEDPMGDRNKLVEFDPYTQKEIRCLMSSTCEFFGTTALNGGQFVAVLVALDGDPHSVAVYILDRRSTWKDPGESSCPSGTDAPALFADGLLTAYVPCWKIPVSQHFRGTWHFFSPDGTMFASFDTLGCPVVVDCVHKTVHRLLEKFELHRFYCLTFSMFYQQFSQSVSVWSPDSAEFVFVASACISTHQHPGFERCPDRVIRGPVGGYKIAVKRAAGGRVEGLSFSFIPHTDDLTNYIGYPRIVDDAYFPPFFSHSG